MSAPTDDQLIVNADLAPQSRRPEPLGAPVYLTLKGHGQPSYRTEAWRLTDGTVVIVVSHGGGPDFPNVHPELRDKILDHWRPIAGSNNGIDIIDDWNTHRHGSAPFSRFTTDSGLHAADLDALDNRGVVLPRN